MGNVREMRTGHLLCLSLFLGAVNACDAPEQKAPPVKTVCTLTAAPPAVPVAGDANGDGFLDVSDGVAYQRYFMAGGAAPACLPAMDVVPDGVADFGDATAIWFHLGPNRSTALPSAEGCTQVERTVDAACANGLALEISAPPTVTGAIGTDVPFTATVTLSSPMLKVEAWSFSLQASGCSITGGSTAGTVAADREDDPPGYRDGGMAWQAIQPEMAEVLTGLDWRNPTTLPTVDAAAIHTFTLSGQPTSDCTPCTLSLVPGTAGTGVETVISGGGYRYLPTLGSFTVSVCAE